MKFFCLILALFIFAVSCNKNNKANSGNLQLTGATNNEWRIKKIQDSKFVFLNNKEFDTHLYNLKLVGRIGTRIPWLIFSGRDCNECDANESIYISLPTNKSFIVENGVGRYHYPGTEKDFENNVLLYKAHAYYGKVLPNVRGVTWYQEELSDKHKMVKSTFLIGIKGDSLIETSKKGWDNFETTLALFKNGKCDEIRGKDLTTEP